MLVEQVNNIIRGGVVQSFNLDENDIVLEIAVHGVIKQVRMSCDDSVTVSLENKPRGWNG